MQVDLWQLVYTLSDALDLVGVDDRYHGKRVAVMAVTVGGELGWDRPALEMLFFGGILHDSGVSSTRVHKQLVTELDWSGADEHCQRGEELLSNFNPLAYLAPLVRYHHTHWNDLIQKDLAEQTALLSNLIYLVDRVDALASQHYGQDLLLARNRIRATVGRYRDTFFAPELVEAFLSASIKEAFWLGLEPNHIKESAMVWMPQPSLTKLESADIRQLAQIFATIVDAKSPFTAEHSMGVAQLSRWLAECAQLPPDTQDQLEIAGMLHDIGKLVVPDEILDKPGELDGTEMAVIRQHSFETYQILKQVRGFEEISGWAAYHHEALNGRGYPFHLGEDDLSIEARIVAASDVFQAMAQKRPYRPSLSPKKILRKMKYRVRTGRLDEELVGLVENNLDACWQAATVV
ncbi:MAG: HD domain-containing protein [Anaerolineales bacterium]|nr:HD domain-containing protein [Anaerolineales bacterium]